LHGAKDCWWRLKWICDIAEFLRLPPELNWPAILEQAKRLRSERILFLGLFLAKDLLEAPLPEEVWRKVRADPVVQRLAIQVHQWLFGKPPVGLKKYFFHLKIREQFKDKLPIFFHYLVIYVRYAVTPNAKDRAVIALPSSLSFPYYVIRVIRLVREKRWDHLKRS
jgi:hypothetical protein